MFNIIKNHLLSNSGDESTSKVIWVAIVFVIGAILLLLVTTAFKEPIQNWYETTVIEWFNGENGQYSYDQWSVYEKNENGTYKGLQYIMYAENGGYQILLFPEDVQHNGSAGDCYMQKYDANGNWDNAEWNYLGGTVVISNDGKTITVDDDVYHAQLP